MSPAFEFVQVVQSRAAAGEENCIPWPFSILKHPNWGGYGTLRHEGRTRRAHVLSLRMWTGVDGTAAGLEAAHYVCGNRACINPLHLRWSTRKENAEDMVRHGTSPAGERHGRVRLSESQVLEMRARRRAGERPTDLAREFGLSQGYVSRLTRGLRWSYLDRQSV